MYALIFWTRSKTTSVVRENDLFPVKDEGEETFVRYESNKRLYKAKIIRKSEDSEYLRRIRVTTTGEICTKDNTMSNLTNAAKKALKSKEKAASKKKADSTHSVQQRLAEEKSVFSDEEDEVTPPARKARKILDSEDESDDKNTKDPKTPVKTHVKRKEKHSISKDITEVRSLCEKGSTSKANVIGCNPSGSINDRAGTSRSNAETESVPQMTDIELLRELRKSLKEVQGRIQLNSNRQGEQISPAPSPTHQNENRPVAPVAAYENSANDDENQSPLDKCRSPGRGRVLLCENYNVWIDPGHLMFIQRWKSDPNEMTRQLLKHLVGKDNLKNMCARGKSNTRPAIPKDIVSCVEYYVNKKCTSSLTVSEFTNVINYLCGTLRNPKLPGPP